MKAQMVKNAVIVPTGAKGGFVVKRPPSEPEALRTEVVECYRAFVRGMLDLTDNLVGATEQRVVHPPDTVIHDGDDTYLVVAADKGTATFSDIANEIALEYGYWLGDAFASGGSTGLRPQGDGHHGARRVGERAPPRQRARQGRRPRSADRGRHRRHVRRRVRQRDAALAGAAPRRRVRPPPRLRRPRSRSRGVVRGAGPPVRAAPLELGRLRRVEAVAGRRRVPAHAQVDRAEPAGAGRARRARPAADAERAGVDRAAGARRPALERRHRHLRQGEQRDQRRRRRPGQRRRARRRRRPALPHDRRGRQPRAHPARAGRVRPRRRARLHRRHRQLGRRRLQRPRGQHQDPARRGRRRRRADDQAAQRACWRR